jgi:hypothetical protein
MHVLLRKKVISNLEVVFFLRRRSFPFWKACSEGSEGRFHFGRHVPKVRKVGSNFGRHIPKVRKVGSNFGRHVLKVRKVVPTFEMHVPNVREVVPTFGMHVPLKGKVVLNSVGVSKGKIRIATESQRTRGKRYF